MSVFVNWLCDGSSQPGGNGWKGRFALWLGRWLALRHERVSIDPSARISPGAFINPRNDSISIGAGCLVAAGAIVQGNVSMGKNSGVQNYSMLVGYGEAGRIVIGDGVRIAPHCMLIAGNHIFADSSKPIHEQGVEGKPIIIEDDVWIAGNVNITAGVRIGRGSVIGAGSVVTKDIPPMSVAVGCPAKVIKSRVQQ